MILFVFLRPDCRCHYPDRSGPCSARCWRDPGVPVPKTAQHPHHTDSVVQDWRQPLRQNSCISPLLWHPLLRVFWGCLQLFSVLQHEEVLQWGQRRILVFLHSKCNVWMQLVGAASGKYYHVPYWAVRVHFCYLPIWDKGHKNSTYCQGRR